MTKKRATPPAPIPTETAVAALISQGNRVLPPDASEHNLFKVPILVVMIKQSGQKCEQL